MNASSDTTEVPLVFDVDTMEGWPATQRNLPVNTFLTAAACVGRMHGPYLLTQSVMTEALGSTEGFTWHSPALSEQAKATAAVWSDCDNPSQLLNAGGWKHSSKRSATR